MSHCKLFGWLLCFIVMQIVSLLLLVRVWVFVDFFLCCCEFLTRIKKPILHIVWSRIKNEKNSKISLINDTSIQPWCMAQVFSVSFSRNQALKGRASSCSNNVFLAGDWSQVSCQHWLVKSDAYKLLKEAPLWQSHLWRDDWAAQWSELFPSRRPALQLLAVDSIHFRKWIACGAFPKS